MLKAIIWDMDGVLADSGEAHLLAWQTLFAERDATITWEQFAETFGMTNEAILGRWLGKGQPASLVYELGRRKEELFRQLMPQHVHILPGVVEWLERGLARGYSQAVASSAEMANIVATVGALGLSNYFQALISGDLLPRSKPDPAIFLQAAAAVGARPADCLVIEDSLAGLEAATRAGMRSLAITTTNPAQKLCQAQLVVDSLAHLDEDCFERLLG